MDQIMGKVGSLMIGQKTNKEMASVEKEINSITTGVEDGAKWLVNKITVNSLDGYPDISITGKVQKPLPELLKDYGLVMGIFPQDVTKYELDEQTGFITVILPSPCEVSYKDSSVLRFAPKITGYIEKGKLTNIEGMKTKVVMMFVKATCIACDGTKIHVTAGMKNTRNKDAYEVLRDGVKIAKF